MKNIKEILDHLLRTLAPRAYCMQLCLQLMESESEIKPILASFLRRFVEVTVNDSFSRKRITGKELLNYKEMVSNEKLARVFSTVGDDIEQTNKTHVTNYIKKLDSSYVKKLNEVLQIALTIREILSYIIFCKKSYISALEKNTSDTQKESLGTQIDTSNKIIEKITKLIKTGTGEDLLELNNSDFLRNL